MCKFFMVIFILRDLKLPHRKHEKGTFMNNLFTIKVNNWHEHNPGKKNTYKKTLIANNIIHDARICALPATHKWLFFSILMICGDYASDTVTLTERQVNDHLTARVGATNALTLLQEYQLVTFEKTALKKERKKERKDLKERRNYDDQENLEKKKLSSEIWEAYKKAYQNRYKIDPVRNAKTNSVISQIASRLGREGIEIVVFYLNHNDSFYLKNMHYIGHCLANAESLRTQFLKGRAITSRDVKNFEGISNSVQLIKDAEKGGF